MVCNRYPSLDLDDWPETSEVTQQLRSLEMWSQGLPSSSMQPAQQMCTILQTCWYQFHWHEVYGDLQWLPQPVSIKYNVLWLSRLRVSTFWSDRTIYLLFVSWNSLIRRYTNFKIAPNKWCIKKTSKSWLVIETNVATLKVELNYKNFHVSLC